MPYATLGAPVTWRSYQEMESDQGSAIIWLSQERVYGYLISLGAFASRVAYVQDGHDYDVWVENDEFEIWEEPSTYGEE